MLCDAELDSEYDILGEGVRANLPPQGIVVKTGIRCSIESIFV